MNLSAEAVPCLSEVSGNDKRWGRPPPVTDRPASWRLRPQSNHTTRKGPALCSWSVTLCAGGAGRGWVKGSGMVDKHSLLFPHRSLNARLIRRHKRMRRSASCRGTHLSIITSHIIQFNMSVLFLCYFSLFFLDLMGCRTLLEKNVKYSDG